MVSPKTGNKAKRSALTTYVHVISKVPVNTITEKEIKGMQIGKEGILYLEGI